MLILASTSVYRRAQLARLGLPFSVESPGVDETAHVGELPRELSGRLARNKAQAVLVRLPAAVVIGSDQVAELQGAALGKPGDRAGAIKQLTACSGHIVRFWTAVCVARASELIEYVDETRCVFRKLSLAQIEQYVDAEQPYDCAGSFKCEGLGIALFESIETSDPSALIGLPLIAVSRALRRFQLLNI